MEKDSLKYFRVEAAELLERMMKGVIQLESKGLEQDLREKILRDAHTLKGAARVVKELQIGDCAHSFEDLIVAIPQDADVPAGVANQLLALLDTVAKRLDEIRLPGINGPTKTASVSLSERTDSEATVLPNEIESVRVEIPEIEALEQGVSEIGTHISRLMKANVYLQKVREATTHIRQKLGKSGDITSSDVEALNESLSHFERSFNQSVDQSEREFIQLQDKAQKLRLVSVKTIFGFLERAARDVASEGKKKIRFEAHGEDIRLDGHVLAAVRNALIHIVRNAVGHGIESESERAAAGKNPTANVNFTVTREHNSIAFVCTDDGRGLDIAAIKKSAVHLGTLDDKAATAMSDEDAGKLIFAPGLSTAEQLSKSAGRGVGLNIAHEITRELNGTIAVQSIKGKSTTIRILIPVSISSIAALLVEADGVAAWVPLKSIRRTVRVLAQDIVHSSGIDTIIHEHQAIPFYPMSQALPVIKSPSSRRAWTALLIGVQDRSATESERLVAIGTDKLLGSRDIISRPLPPMPGRFPSLSGTTLDTEGNLQLVLDPANLVAEAQKGGRVSLGMETAKARDLPILVVDDSLTTRMLEERILQAAGYEVVLAKSGEEGLEKAAIQEFGLFLVDVEMPGMTGFEFVSRTRSDPRLREIPAIIVSSRGSDDFKRRGMEAGAQGYIVKGNFNENQLITMIRGLIGRL